MKYLICPQCTLRNDVVETKCLRCGANLEEVIPREDAIAGERPPSQQREAYDSARRYASEQGRQVAAGVSSVIETVKREPVPFDDSRPFPYAWFFVSYIEARARWNYRWALAVHFVWHALLALTGIVFYFRTVGFAGRSGGFDDAAWASAAGLFILVLYLAFVILGCILGYWTIRFLFYLAMATADFYKAFLKIEENTRGA
jgi:hypothetical protein